MTQKVSSQLNQPTKVAVSRRDAAAHMDASTSRNTSNNQSEFQWQKIEMFIWRLAYNSLPIKRNVVWRGIKLDTICPVCKSLDEDCGHLFFKCKYVKLGAQWTWKRSDLYWRPANLEMKPSTEFGP